MGRFPFPSLVRGKKGSKTPKKGQKYLKKGGVPKTPFLPQFWKQIFLGVIKLTGPRFPKAPIYTGIK